MGDALTIDNFIQDCELPAIPNFVEESFYHLSWIVSLRMDEEGQTGGWQGMVDGVVSKHLIFSAEKKTTNNTASTVATIK